MAWEQLTLADVRRLVAAIEQASSNPQAVRAIIDRMPADNGEHSRVTLGTLVNLLNQLNGRTVLSSEDLQLLNRPDESVIVQPTFAELVAACHLNEVSDDFTEDNFPLVADNTTGQIKLVCLNKPVSCRNFRAEFESSGYVPIGIRRAMEWLANNQEEFESETSNIVIGAARENYLRQLIYPRFIYRDGKKRIEVGHLEIDDSFNRYCHFLVCRK